MFLKNYIHPSPELQKYISQCDVDKNYIGVHIRKGDAITGPWSKHYKESKDEYFENIIRAYVDTPVFLSTVPKKFIGSFDFKTIPSILPETKILFILFHLQQFLLMISN